MKVQYLSDIHANFNEFTPQYCAETLVRNIGAKVLVVAGDVSNHMKETLDWLAKVANLIHHDHILFVPGNHEYYNIDHISAKKLIQEFKHERITILDDTDIVIDDVAFFGSTLWTNFRKGDPMAIIKCCMRDEWGETPILDFNKIRLNPHGESVTAQHMMEWNAMTEAYLEMFLAEHEKRKRVVITHFLPTRQCIHRKYIMSELNPFYASDHDRFVERAHVWIYGHSHDTVDFDRGMCKVRNNPHGLPKFKDEGAGFLSTKYIEP